MKCRIIEHDAIATPILDVLPLVLRERIQAPDRGVVIVLEDGKRLNWLVEGGHVPEAFDLLIRDDVFGTGFIVTPRQYAERFTAIAEETGK